MNEIISKFLLNGDKFMPELHLKQLGFTYSACGHLLNIVKEFWSYFANEATYSDSKDLTKRTISDKCLKDRA